MTRFQYRFITHPQNLSDFGVNTMQHGACLLIGATAPNAKTLVNSKRWTELEILARDPAAFEEKIEEICHSFTEHYLHIQRLRNEQNGFQPSGEIIESLAVLFLGADGNSYFYQAGKCLVMIVKRNGTHFPASTGPALSALELTDDDRLVIDLQNAGVLASAGNFISLQNPPDTLPVEMPHFTYPFAIAHPLLQREEGPISEPLPSESVQAPEPGPFLPPVQEHIPLENRYKNVAQKPYIDEKLLKKRSQRVWAGLFLALAVSGAAIVGWEVADQAAISKSITRQTPAGQPDVLSAAGEAMRQADQSLMDGHNQKALAALSRAELLYTQYLAAHPDDRLPAVRTKINEIRQKKRLLSKADNF